MSEGGLPRRRGTRPGLTRAESRRLTRQRLLAAAKVEFAQRGLHGANLTDILQRAEVSPGAFYHQFSDKTDLFLAVAEEFSEVIRRMVRQSRELLANPGGSLFRWIRDLFRQGLALIEENAELFRIFIREQHSDDPRIRSFLDRNRYLFEAEVRDGLDELIEREYLPAFDTAWAAHLIWMLAFAAAAQQLERPADSDDWARAVTLFVLGGISAVKGMRAAPPEFAAPPDPVPEPEAEQEVPT